MEFGKLIDEFNRENVWEIHVDKVQGGSISEVARTFSDSLETSDRLDLVATSPEYLAGWNSSGHIIDLTSFITNPEWGIPDKEKASFLSQVWEANKTDEQQMGFLPSSTCNSWFTTRPGLQNWDSQMFLFLNRNFPNRSVKLPMPTVSIKIKITMALVVGLSTRPHSIDFLDKCLWQ